MKAKRILIVYGTRPEAIKLAPIIWGMQKDGRFLPTILVSGQHDSLLQEANKALGLTADIDLKIMRAGQSLSWIHDQVFTGVSAFLEERPFDLLLVQGDTSTAMAAALAAFLQKLPIAHVEAGLRSHDLMAPFPEEANRKIISQIASVHLCPTDTSKENLLREGVHESTTHVTGNTVIDALNSFLQKLPSDPPPALQAVDFKKKVVVVTTHRRENIGPTIESIAKSIANLARQFSEEVEFAVIVHPNPAVKASLLASLAGISNVQLLEPLPYPDMVYLLSHSNVVLTDSGGLQEEATYLGKHLVVLRAKTERVEGIVTGNAILSGVKEGELTQAISAAVLDNGKSPEARAIYGHGKAAERILDILAV